MEEPRGTDRAGRRRKRFLTPQQKYEIWLQLVRGECTIAEAADRAGVDRATVMKLRTVAKEGALGALATSRPRAGGGPGRDRPPFRSSERDGCPAHARGGKRALGLSGRVPRRVDAATKASLLELLDRALADGFEHRAACAVLELKETRAWRWRVRCGDGRLGDHPAGGRPVHGLLPEERAEIVALVEQWGEVDRSHRKLAHRGLLPEPGVGLALLRSARSCCSRP